MQMTNNLTFFLFKKTYASINNLKTCISDVRTWMINNKLKINDKKRNFSCFNLFLINMILVHYIWQLVMTKYHHC